MKSTNVPVYREKPRARCGWCLGPAWNEAETCRHCRGIESNLHIGYTDAHALRGGRWVTRGGIKVWTGPRPLDDEQVRNQYGRAKCGTNGGYVNHIRYAKTKPCEPCKKAHAEANRIAAKKAVA